MLYQESETVELKSEVVDDIRKEIIAFANCDGGKLYIGVEDDGTVVGLSNPDETALRISNMVRDSIKPDVTMFIHYKVIDESGKIVLSVEVQRGTNRPYYLARKGMRPEGVYVRQGFSSVPATDASIRSMIKETDGNLFEEMRSVEQNLTFDAMENEFNMRHMEVGTHQMRTLKLIDRDGLYTNLAVLLSDQNIHTVKVAVFQGSDQTVFKDRREFSGSLLKQMNEVYEYIDFRNQTRSTIDKLSRIDVRDYPEIAVREALLNLLVHRDYGFRASSFINIYDNRIEFVSIGGLVPGIELEDAMAGISICRNPALANVFYRLHLIEAYGTGLSKIMNVYAKFSEEPIIETTKNTFKIILPNVNMGNSIAKRHEEYPAIEYTTRDETPQHFVSDVKIDYDESRVLERVSECGYITRAEAERVIGTSASTASRMLRRLVNNGYLEQIGKARNSRYVLKKRH